MSSKEGERLIISGEAMGSKRLTRFLHSFDSPEPVALVLIALLLFVVVVTGNLLGFW
ncbi:hypothetical protein [Natrinema sp. SYSU A 869]|uniref:hypothetical protein n=1 Tax=Natrinema sp. SYSU A 869 TaxID=2871694 RepID=UPI001CA4378B|nr:hypothetical protein [Natrinema sp. SYSU A 869]